MVDDARWLRDWDGAPIPAPPDLTGRYYRPVKDWGEAAWVRWDGPEELGEVLNLSASGEFAWDAEVGDPSFIWNPSAAGVLGWSGGSQATRVRNFNGSLEFAWLAGASALGFAVELEADGAFAWNALADIELPIAPREPILGVEVWRKVLGSHVWVGYDPADIAMGAIREEGDVARSSGAKVAVTPGGNVIAISISSDGALIVDEYVVRNLRLENVRRQPLLTPSGMDFFSEGALGCYAVDAEHVVWFGVAEGGGVPGVHVVLVRILAEGAHVIDVARASSAWSFSGAVSGAGSAACAVFEDLDQGRVTALRVTRSDGDLVISTDVHALAPGARATNIGVASNGAQVWASWLESGRGLRLARVGPTFLGAVTVGQGFGRDETMDQEGSANPMAHLSGALYTTILTPYSQSTTGTLEGFGVTFDVSSGSVKRSDPLGPLPNDGGLRVAQGCSIPGGAIFLLRGKGTGSDHYRYFLARKDGFVMEAGRLGGVGDGWDVQGSNLDLAPLPDSRVFGSFNVFDSGREPSLLEFLESDGHDRPFVGRVAVSEQVAGRPEGALGTVPPVLPGGARGRRTMFERLA